MAESIRVRPSFKALIAIGATITFAAPASAQAVLGPFLESSIPLDVDRGRQTSVLDRERPEYEPDGVDLAGFTLLPSVQAGVGASSNVFGASTGKESDVYFTLDPQVRLRSNWARHAFSINAAAALRRFASQSERNETGLSGGADGRLDVSQDLNIIGSGRIQRAFQSQFASDAPTDAADPIKYVKYTALARATYNPGRLRLTAAGDIIKLDFTDVRSVTGVVVDQDFRDRTTYRGAVRAEYAIDPDFAGFVETSLAKIDHRVDLVGTIPNRDGKDWRLLAGTNFDIVGVARARIGIGYIRRTFDASLYKTMSGFGYDGRLEFFPSGLTTITVAAQRTIEEAYSVGISGYYSNGVLGRVDHELLRNLILFGQGEYQNNRFEGVSRRDKVFIAQAGGIYLMNQNFRFTAGLSYSDRKSSGAVLGPSFNDFRGVIAVTAAM